MHAMSPWFAALVGAIAVYAFTAWRLLGRVKGPRDLSALRELLGLEEPTLSGPGREKVAALEDALVKAGWVHTDYVRDPDHYDKAGRYLWWGM